LLFVWLGLFWCWRDDSKQSRYIAECSLENCTEQSFVWSKSVCVLLNMPIWFDSSASYIAFLGSYLETNLDGIFSFYRNVFIYMLGYIILMVTKYFTLSLIKQHVGTHFAFWCSCYDSTFCCFLDSGSRPSPGVEVGRNKGAVAGSTSPPQASPGWCTTCQVMTPHAVGWRCARNQLRLAACLHPFQHTPRPSRRPSITPARLGSTVGRFPFVLFSPFCFLLCNFGSPFWSFLPLVLSCNFYYHSQIT
jgi:hypothetical protein